MTTTKVAFRLTIAQPMLAVAACVLALLMLLFPVVVARADIAPPSQPPGANPQPGAESTQVRMLAETVLIDVLGDVPPGSLGQAQVTADFRMENLGNSTETLQVRFPISANDGFFNYPEISDLRVHVDGANTPTTRLTLPDPVFDDPIAWAAFPVTFPPGVEVEVRVAYTLRGTGEYPFVSYSYLLETGAGWQGTIGSVDLVVRLPYEANPFNVFIDSSPGWGQTTSGAILTGREVRWHYEDLEPTPGDNLSVALVNPGVWKRVLAEQTSVEANPTDGEAWGRLGKLYKETSLLRRGVRYDTGGLSLYDLSVEAYEQAVTLLPDDALWHAGFGDLLFSRYYYDEFLPRTPEMSHLERAIQEYARAYTLDPDNPQIQEMLAEVRSALPEALALQDGRYVFLWLTATPTPQPSLTPTAPTQIAQLPASQTATIVPSATVPPASPTEIPPAEKTLTPTGLPAATPTTRSPATPFCGGALVWPALLSIAAMSAVRLDRRRRR